MKTSMIRKLSSLVICWAVPALSGMAFSAHPALAQALVRDRIVAPIRADQVQVVKGTIHPLVAVATDQGTLDGATVIHGMSLVFARSAAQQADLAGLLGAQQQKGSSMYHQWLTPSQFANRYGTSQHDLAMAASWLKSQGFTIDAIPPSSDRVVFSGTSARVESVFRTQMHRYLLHGRPAWANSTELSFPQAIAGMVLGVRHLTTFRPRPHLRTHAVHVARNTEAGLKPRYSVTDQNGNLVNFLAPQDVHIIYDMVDLYNASVTGQNQYIAVMGQTDITQYQSDIQIFRTLSGLDASNLPQQILVPGSGPAAVFSSDLGEADLDVEWSGADAKDAKILYVTVGNDPNYSVFDSLSYAIQTPLINGNQVVPVISISYGNCEQNYSAANIQSIVQLLQQANAQGQTVIAAAGDSGSADCDLGANQAGKIVAASHGLAVDFPGSSPYTTSGGGTSFSGDLVNPAKYWNQVGNYSANGSALTYIPESAWNDTSSAILEQQQGNLSAGGGGASVLFAKPQWQAGPGVPNDNKRDVPDVSLSADPNQDGYVLCTQETDSSGNITGPSCVANPDATLGQVPYFDASGQGTIFGGTSAVAPQLAGMITLWNQAAGYKNGIGNANYLFYALARTTPAVFHDVVPQTVSGVSGTTLNTNAVVCVQGTPNCIPDPNASGNFVMSCCSVTPGYDKATGLGSVDVGAIASAWSSVTPNVGNTFTGGVGQPDFQVVANPSVVKLGQGGSEQVALNVGALYGFTGPVNLSCKTLNNSSLTCSFGASPGTPTTSVNAGAAATLNVSDSGTALLHSPSTPANPWQRLTGGGIAFCALFLISIPKQRRRFLARLGSKARWSAMAVLLLVACVGITIGCGSNSVPSGGGGGGGGGGTVAPPPPGPAPNISGAAVIVTAASAANPAQTHQLILNVVIN